MTRPQVLKRFLPAPAAHLRGVGWVDPDHSTASLRRFAVEEVQKLLPAPEGVAVGPTSGAGDLEGVTRRGLIWQKMGTALDRFRRIWIPKPLRERLGLELEDGKLILLPRRTPPPLRRKGRVLVVESEATADLGQALAHLREERLEELFR